jgi:acetoin utilization deacetylase AcuC-like enzyme
MVRCSVISGEIFFQHDLEAHDESSDRLHAIRAQIPDEVPVFDPQCATEDDLERVHTKPYVRMIQEFSSHGGHHFIDENTYITGESFKVASCAAGAAMEALQRSIDGENCFALIRPPGHHAEPDRGMGFCIFNNASIAVTKALDRVERVAIVDWDVHHGNGTQKIFYGNDRVLYCSIHQGNIFPHSGWVDEVGTGRGKGFTINAPMRPGSTIADYRFVFEKVFIPAINRFLPDALIISAGQDALADDPKSDMLLSPVDYGTLSGLLRDGTGLSLALVLEGGYGPSHQEAIASIISSLRGAPVLPGTGSPRQSTSDLVAVLKKMTL